MPLVVRLTPLAVVRAGTGPRCVWAHSRSGNRTDVRAAPASVGGAGLEIHSPDSNQPIERHRLAFFPPTPGAIAWRPRLWRSSRSHFRVLKGVGVSVLRQRIQERRLMLNSAFPPAIRRGPRHLCVALASLVAAPGGRARDRRCCGLSCHAVDVRVDVLAGAGRRHASYLAARWSYGIVERRRQELDGRRWRRTPGRRRDGGRELRIERAQRHDPGGDVHRPGRGLAGVHAAEPGLRRRHVGQRRSCRSRGSLVDRRAAAAPRATGCRSRTRRSGRAAARTDPGFVERRRRSGRTTSSRASCRAAAQSMPTRSSPTRRTTSTSTTTTCTTTSRAS